MATNDFEDFMSRFEALMEDARSHGIECITLFGEHDPIAQQYSTGWHSKMNPYTAIGLLGTVLYEIQEQVLGSKCDGCEND